MILTFKHTALGIHRITFVGMIAIILCISFSRKCDAVQESQALSISAVKRTVVKLRPLHSKLGKPEPDQWLATHEEKGQSLNQYLRSRPNVLSGQRRKLYVQPIGEFTETEKGFFAEFSGFAL